MRMHVIAVAAYKNSVVQLKILTEEEVNSVKCYNLLSPLQHCSQNALSCPQYEIRQITRT